LNPPRASVPFQAEAFTAVGSSLTVTTGAS
jgi:hypothetical protein